MTNEEQDEDEFDPYCEEGWICWGCGIDMTSYEHERYGDYCLECQEDSERCGIL